MPNADAFTCWYYEQAPEFASLLRPNLMASRRVDPFGEGKGL
jgi:hypothetical protein